jgi:hypothetical protein
VAKHRRPGLPRVCCYPWSQPPGYSWSRRLPSCPSLGELRRWGRRAMYLRPCLGERWCWGSRAMPPHPCLGELRRRPAAHPRGPSAGLPATRMETTCRWPHPGASDWICRLPAPEVLFRTDPSAPCRPSRAARHHQRRNARETGSDGLGIGVEMDWRLGKVWGLFCKMTGWGSRGELLFLAFTAANVCESAFSGAFLGFIDEAVSFCTFWQGFGFRRR